MTLEFVGGGRFKVFQDRALCFGDKAVVYGYNRVRAMLTTFFEVAFAMAV